MNNRGAYSNPIISVMMPTYNVKKYVSSAIDSVLQQTFSNWELIIVDDGSTDGTVDILNLYAKQDERIKVYYHEHAGRGKARNRCLEYSRGKYIAVCDSDDISFPERFEKQVNFLEKNTNIGAVGAQICSFREEAVFDASKIIYWPTDSKEITKGFQHKRMKIANCAAMVRSSLFDKYGEYNEELKRAQDYEFFKRGILKGIPLANLPEVLVFYRQLNQIPSYHYFEKNAIYTSYAEYLLAGGSKNFQEFMAQPQTKIKRYLIPYNYLLFMGIMEIKKFKPNIFR